MNCPYNAGGTRLSGPPFKRWIIDFGSPGTTSVPLRPFGGTRLSGPPIKRWIIDFGSPGTTSVPLRPFGGTCLSRPSFNVQSSIAFYRRLKSPGWNRGTDRSGTRPSNPCHGKPRSGRRFVTCSIAPGSFVPYDKTDSAGFEKTEQGKLAGAGPVGHFRPGLQSSWGLVSRLTRK